jgi:hypothetical protein
LATTHEHDHMEQNKIANDGGGDMVEVLVDVAREVEE